jgi:hypothetical protein
VPLTDVLRVVEDGLTRAHVSDGVPIAPVDTIVIMKLIAGRTQDLADVEAIIASSADRENLRTTVLRTVPDRADTLERLFVNVDRDG